LNNYVVIVELLYNN